MGQSWLDLLFAHWPVDPDVLRPLVPADLDLDLDRRGGRAWIAVTPFEVAGLRLRGLPPVPYASRFPELNVRTYVTVDGRPGIFFVSLDAARLLAVTGARTLYRLPYFHARMTIERTGDGVLYRSTRRSPDGRSFVARYRPTGRAAEPETGSLEAFLVERYCLYTVDRGRVLRAEIHHAPWVLRPAEARIEVNTMLPVSVPVEPPLLHLAARQDVVIWPPRRV